MADHFSDVLAPSSSSSSTRRAIMISAGVALVSAGLVKRNKAGMAASAAGAGLVVLGAMQSAGDHVQQYGPIRRAVTIRKSEDEIRRFLTDPHSVGAIVQPVIAVRTLETDLAEFRFHRPAGDLLLRSRLAVQDAGHSLHWQAESGGELSIRFAPGPEASTEVHAEISALPQDRIRGAIRTLQGLSPSQVLRESLRHLKQLLEAGEIPTTRGQVSGRRKWIDRTKQRALGETSKQPLAG